MRSTTSTHRTTGTRRVRRVVGGLAATALVALPLTACGTEEDAGAAAAASSSAAAVPALRGLPRDTVRIQWHHVFRIRRLVHMRAARRRRLLLLRMLHSDATAAAAPAAPAAAAVPAGGATAAAHATAELSGAQRRRTDIGAARRQCVHRHL